MLTISYTITPFLTRYGEKLEYLRRNILIAIISPREELSLQFDASISRIYFALIMDGENITKDEVKKIIANQMHFTSQTKSQFKRQNPVSDRVLRYKQAIDYIHRDWLVSKEPVTVEAIIKIHTLASPGKLRVSKSQLKEVLDYLEITKDNPFIQAGIAKLVLNALEPFTEGNSIFSTLCSYLFLYKAGLNYRQLLVLEEAWAKNILVFNGQYKTALKKTNITGWLEYFFRSANSQLEIAHQNITKDNQGNQKKSGRLAELNARQKNILSLFNEPTTTITNRDIQKLFTISQITASRDLAKLTSLNLIFTHGKGRSVKYTRV